MEGSSLKHFKVTDESRKKTYLIMYKTYDAFVDKCKAKFKVPEESMVFFVLEDDEECELDSDAIPHVVKNKTLLIMKVEANVSDRHKQKVIADDDKNKAKETEKVIADDDKYKAKETDFEEEESQGVGTGDFYVVDKSKVEEWEKTENGSEMREHISKFGLKDIGNVLKKNLDKWKEKPLNIAVTGASGKGKSSFINALRGISSSDPGAAAVDVKECTKNLVPYKHPEHDNFIIWDIPGVGTAEFPQETYFEKINIDKYDFFIVVTTERFTAIDAWLMREVKLRKKSRYILRTKIDVDLWSVKQTRKRQGCFNEIETFKQLKKEFLEELLKTTNGESDFRFFVISNYHTNKYDFPNLELQLFQDVPSEKKRCNGFGRVWDIKRNC